MSFHRVVPVLLILLLTAIPCLADTTANASEVDSHFDGVVYTPTRFPQPRSRVADNIVVVTAKEIEGMHAHTVAEVLNRVNGVFVNFTRDFGAASLLTIQGSEQRHVLVLLDGTEWNFLSDGHAETNSIPVEIIRRIEIIKGPASSTWGSALGGVINIITKEADDPARPAGELKGSYGERDTRDSSAQFSGGTRKLGYYAYAGEQYSDGLVDSRGFDRKSGFAKLLYTFSPGINLGVSMGYSNPDIDFGDFPSVGISSGADERVSFFKASLDARIVKNLDLALSFYNKKSDLLLDNETLGAGELFQDSRFDEELIGGSARLIWKHLNTTAVLGMDISRGDLDQEISTGRILQYEYKTDPVSKTDSDTKKWALYTNGTFTFDRFSITPGIRFDHNDITGSFISPSIGITYRLGGSIVRASVSRGFTVPSLSLTSGGGLFLEPNPDLEPEEIWSYQAGIETTVVKYLRIKSSLFYHDQKRAQVTVPGQKAPNTVENRGNILRRGFEFGIETLPFYNITLSGNLVYTDIDPANDSGASDIYTGNLGIGYDDKKTLKAQLTGHYVWWDAPGGFQSDYDDFIWDISFSRLISLTGRLKTEVFCMGHNIFNGSQQDLPENISPGRWIEAGIKLTF